MMTYLLISMPSTISLIFILFLSLLPAGLNRLDLRKTDSLLTSTGALLGGLILLNNPMQI